MLNFKNVKTVVGTYGKIDVLVNNAHASRNKSFEEITEKEIGRVAVFLASEDSNYITGQPITIDGGAMMLR